MDESVTWAIGPAIARGDIPVLCERLTVLLHASSAPAVLCDLGAITEPDAVTLEAVARLQLTAQRLGRGIRFQRPARQLLDLLVLTGLGATLGLEFHRQAEQREQAFGVEEVVDSDDLPG